MALTGSSATSAATEPYLWLHLAGIAALPLCLEFCLAGLRASGLPMGLVLPLVALAGIGPAVWMQWRRPFCVFSLVVLALKPEHLSETQRRILAQFKAPIGKIITVIVAGMALVILWQLGQWMPSIRLLPIAGGRFGGLLLAMVSFLVANLVLQVPASVLPVLLTPDAKLMPPYPAARVSSDFTLIGLRVKQILPAISAASMAVPAPTVPAPTVPAPTAPSSPIVEAAQPEESASGDFQPEPVQPEPVQPEPVVIHSLSELIPPEIYIPQASHTVVTIVANAPVLNSPSAPASIPEPAEPNVRNTVVRVLVNGA